ncbi:hypothetical protein SAMN06266982_11290 [Propioniciclava tarda]|nr:hypothetical protein SAMN06266982_11290 [Propioniciclava tarda]
MVVVVVAAWTGGVIRTGALVVTLVVASVVAAAWVVETVGLGLGVCVGEALGPGDAMGVAVCAAGLLTDGLSAGWASATVAFPALELARREAIMAGPAPTPTAARARTAAAAAAPRRRSDPGSASGRAGGESVYGIGSGVLAGCTADTAKRAWVAGC